MFNELPKLKHKCFLCEKWRFHDEGNYYEINWYDKYLDNIPSRRWICYECQTENRDR